MFIRRKYNRSGRISVVVVDKSGGRFKEIHRVGILMKRLLHLRRKAAIG